MAETLCYYFFTPPTFNKPVLTDYKRNQVVKVRNPFSAMQSVSCLVTSVSVTHLLAQQITFLQHTI